MPDFLNDRERLADLQLIDEDPPSQEQDLQEAYSDGYADAIDDAVLLVKALVRATKTGSPLRHGDMLKLQRALEAKAN